MTASAATSALKRLIEKGSVQKSVDGLYVKA
jgi:hypothetical protein